MSTRNEAAEIYKNLEELMKLNYSDNSTIRIGKNSMESNELWRRFEVN